MTSMRYSTLLTMLHRDWLLGVDAQVVVSRFQVNLSTLQQVTSTFNRRPTVLIAESEPSQFLAGFFAAVACNCPVFLTNPAWKSSEWQQVWTQVLPDVVWGTIPEGDRLNEQNDGQVTQTIRTRVNRSTRDGWIMIPTGGTSGHIRFVIHTWETLTASVEGFRQFFQVDEVNAYCVLPLYHVSGLMQVLRCFVSAGTLAIAPFKTMEQSPKLHCNPGEYFLSLVPTQLQRLMRSPDHCAMLAQFRTVLLGGAPAWPALLDAARSHRIPLAPTYGMTETASQVVTLRPERFLDGQIGVGQVLPHAEISIQALDKQPKPDASLADVNRTDLAESQTVGEIAIRCTSLAIGYYPDVWFESGVYHPDDIGYVDAHGNLQVMGRSSDKIISGGENIFPIDVETVIRSTGLVADVVVLGISDRQWGQRVTALCVPIHDTVTAEAIERELIPRLSRYKHPKQWVLMSQLPRNAQGKLNREELLKQVMLSDAHD
ncbi:MAG: 2-succinylbenzoate--CoA ligase [Cyanobacteria bacterium J06627_8]